MQKLFSKRKNTVIKRIGMYGMYVLVCINRNLKVSLEIAPGLNDRLNKKLKILN